MPDETTGRGAARIAETCQYGIRVIDPATEGDSLIAARLHCALFGDIGPIAKLGERLVARYCYDHILRAGLMKALLLEIDGRPAGLAAYTGNPVELHSAALGAHFPVVLRETLVAVIESPRLLARLPAAMSLFWERRRERLPQTAGNFAELVAFGVLPEFRTMRFIRNTGLMAPEVLLDYVLDDARAQGFASGRGVVLVSNRAAVRFFQARCSRIEPYPAAVRPSVQVWFDLTNASPERRRTTGHAPGR